MMMMMMMMMRMMILDLLGLTSKENAGPWRLAYVAKRIPIR